jgi:hypothetical protein
MRKIRPHIQPVIDPKLLPPAETRRWTAQRKAAVVVAVREGLLGWNEACERYMLSDRELREWQDMLSEEGIAGLLLKKRDLKRARTSRLNKS